MGRWHGLKSVNLKSVAAAATAAVAAEATAAAVAAAESYVLRRVGVGERERGLSSQAALSLSCCWLFPGDLGGDQHT